MKYNERLTERTEYNGVKYYTSRAKENWVICYPQYVSHLHTDVDKMAIRLAEFEDAIENGDLVSKEWHDEQVLHLQAENDRLNDMKFTQEHCDLYKENEWLKAELKRELDDHEEFTKKANEEIERLTEEKTESAKTAVEILEQNIELQKQVDELKGKVKDQQKEVRMARGFCIHEKRRTESAKALATCKNKIGLAEQKRQYKRGYDKAVKDTAKEILTKANELWLDTINPNCLINKIEQWIKERYGVEVE